MYTRMHTCMESDHELGHNSLSLPDGPSSVIHFTESLRLHLRICAVSVHKQHSILRFKRVELIQAIRGSRCQQAAYGTIAASRENRELWKAIVVGNPEV